jgi:hypothetical protein
MQRNPSGEYDRRNGTLPRKVPCVAGPLATVEDEAHAEALATDPLASDAPLRRQSEWPTSDELESAMLEADPFEATDANHRLTGEIAELFGDNEAHLPRDTVPAPPPGIDEFAKLDAAAARHRR